jgi:hypothetical protein
MPTSNPNPKPAPADFRRALTLLAASADGATEAILLAHGFAVELLADLVRTGLATAHYERVFAGKRAIRVTRVKITKTGERALVLLKRK